MPHLTKFRAFLQSRGCTAASAWTDDTLQKALSLAVLRMRSWGVKAADSEARDDSGKWTSGGGTGGGHGGGSGAQSARPKSGILHRATKILAAAASVPRKAISTAKQLGAAALGKIEQRYGTKVKRAVQIAVLASLPIPMPGMSVVLSAPIVAFAELFRQFGTKAATWIRKAAEIDADLVRKLAKEVLAEIFGGEIPDEVDLDGATDDDGTTEKSFDTITTKAIDERSKEWLRLHGRGEKEIAAAALLFLQGQADELQKAIEKATASGMPADEQLVQRLFDQQAFASGFQNQVEPALLAAAARGAKHQWDQFGEGEPAVDVVDDAKEKAKKKHDPVWWFLLAGFFLEELTRAARKASSLGLTGREFAASVVAPISDDHAENKARNFGVTESTGMTNFGGDVGREHLKIAGLQFKRVWWTVQDDRVRPTHQAAHGQEEDLRGQFIVGGHTCNFPGDPSLPLAERAGCRCVVLTLTTSGPMQKLPGRRRAGKAWEEDKHPRADDGKFGHGGGGGHHETSSESSKPHDHASTVDAWLSHEQNAHVSKDVRAKIGKAMTETFERMPPAMATAVKERMGGPPKLYSSLDDVTAEFKSRGETVAGDEMVSGFYSYAEKTIHVDHGWDGSHEDAVHVYGHEFGHVLDQDNQLSRQPEWKAAWASEINRRGPHGTPISDYATTNPSEGFAEFTRALTTEPEQARKLFPKCWGFFESQGLVGGKTS